MEGVLLEADDVIEVDNDGTQPVVVDQTEILIFREEISSDISQQ